MILRWLAGLALLGATGLPLAVFAQPADPFCAADLHASYTTFGPDGLTYPTWHPQQHPSGCTFDHEHGMGPAAVGVPLPPYGYAPARAGVDEPHEGFKSFAFRDDAGRGWAITIHQGTQGATRACIRFHSLHYLVAAPDGRLVADLHALGDFGGSTSNVNAAAPLAPDACPHQHQQAVAAGSYGSRHLPVVTEFMRMYEPWHADQRHSALGILFAELAVVVFDPATACADLGCNAVVPTGRPGTDRTLSLGSGFRIEGAPGRGGVFWTDPSGRSLVAAPASDSVRQWLAPGAVLVPFGRAVTIDGDGEP